MEERREKDQTVRLNILELNHQQLLALHWDLSAFSSHNTTHHTTSGGMQNGPEDEHEEHQQGKEGGNVVHSSQHHHQLATKGWHEAHQLENTQKTECSKNRETAGPSLPQLHHAATTNKRLWLTDLIWNGLSHNIKYLYILKRKTKNLPVTPVSFDLCRAQSLVIFWSVRLITMKMNNQTLCLHVE